MNKPTKCKKCRLFLTDEELDNEGQTICDDCWEDMEMDKYADACESYPDGGKFF